MKRAEFRSRWVGVIIPILLILVLLTGCKKEDDAKSGLVGRLAIEGGSPQGATAMLFEDPSRNFNSLSVWNVTAHQPAVGFPYDPQAGFEWRDMNVPGRNLTASATATVGADGAFNIAGQPEGLYILVVEKAGYGWTAPMAVNLNQPTVDVGTLQLYAEETLSGISSGSRALLSGHHYVVPDFSTYTVAAGDTVRMQAGAVVRGGDGALIRVQGSMISEGQPDEWCVFTSNLDTRLGKDDWEGIRFQLSGGNPGVGQFRYTRFSNCVNAVLSIAADCELDHCFFSNIFGYGVDASSGKAVLSRCVFDHINTPVRVVLPDSVRMEHSVIFSARILGAEIKRVNGGSVYCNWFEDCGQVDSTAVLDVGVILLQDCQNMDISQNNFYTSWYAFNVQGGVRGNVNIHNNRFDRMNRIIDLRAAPSQGPSYPTFQANCLLTVDNYYIFIHACWPDRDSLDMDARFGYWNTLSEEAAHVKINDCRDNPDCPCVEIVPMAEACATEMGICTQ